MNALRFGSTARLPLDVTFRCMPPSERLLQLARRGCERALASRHRPTALRVIVEPSGSPAELQYEVRVVLLCGLVTVTTFGTDGDVLEALRKAFAAAR